MRRVASALVFCAGLFPVLSAETADAQTEPATQPETKPEPEAKPEAKVKLSPKDLVQLSQKTVEDWQRKLDERIKAVVESMASIPALAKDLHELEKKITELEKKIDDLK